MKTFIVENKRKFQTIRVNLHNPPYDDENVLNKTGWKIRDCIITEVYSKNDGDLENPSMMDHEIGDE